MGTRRMKTLRLRDAETRLSDVIDDALAGEPSLITRDGRPEAVVVSVEVWEQLNRAATFGALLGSFPDGAGEFVTRDDRPARSTEL